MPTCVCQAWQREFPCLSPVPRPPAHQAPRRGEFVHLRPVSFQSVPRLSLSLATVPEDLSSLLRPCDYTSTSPCSPISCDHVTGPLPEVCHMWAFEHDCLEADQDTARKVLLPPFCRRKCMLRETGDLPRATQRAELSTGGRGCLAPELTVSPISSPALVSCPNLGSPHPAV